MVWRKLISFLQHLPEKGSQYNPFFSPLYLPNLGVLLEHYQDAIDLYCQTSFTGKNDSLFAS